MTTIPRERKLTARERPGSSATDAAALLQSVLTRLDRMIATVGQR